MIDLDTIAKRIRHYRWFANLRARRGFHGDAKFFRDRARMEIQHYRELAG
jgi:ferritin